MARVYLADDVQRGGRVALKVLHPDLAAGNAARFAREIQLAAQLDHPNVLAVVDSGDANGLLWYAMPFIEGETLRDRLNRETSLPVAEVLRITRQVGAALDCAHGKQIVHRDVKPENILLDDGQALVADFGVARAIGGESTRITATGMTVGTPTYMAPEQALGEREVDGRADLYALGCVTYEMLTGTPPYRGPSPRAILTQSLRDPIPSVHAVRETVPLAVDRVLERALAKQAADRFASGAEFATALDRAFATPMRGDTAEMPTLQPVRKPPSGGRLSEIISTIFGGRPRP
jgi:serine/threonine-protein kinase